MSAAAFDPTRTRLAQEWKYSSPLLAARFDPSGRYVFASAQDNTIQRFALADGQRTAFTGSRTWVRAMTCAEKDRILLSADYSGQLLAWPMDGGAPTLHRRIQAHKGWVRSLALSPDGKWLASCGNDLAIRLWSIPDLQLAREFLGHSCHVYSVAFSPDGARLASGDLKGKIRLWDVATGTMARDLDASSLYKYDPTFHADHGGVRALAFRRDGGLLACAGITEVTNAFAGVGKPSVLLFDPNTGERKLALGPKADFRGTTWGVAFHPDGTVIAAGGGNGGALWFWKPTEALAFHTQTIPNNARDLDMHSDGRRLVIPCYDGVLRLYDMAPAS